MLSSPSPGQRAPIPTASIERLAAPERLLFASTDDDEVQSMVGRVMKPHRFDVLGHERLHARMHYAPLGEVSVSRLRYGATVVIEPGPLEDFFLVQMPIAGGARIESGPQHVDSDTDVASVLSPTEDTRMRWLAGNDQLMVRLSRSLVERTLIGHLGHPLRDPLRFDVGFRWRESPQWCGLLSYLLECSLQSNDLMKHKLVISHIEQLTASVLVTSHRHNHSETAPVRRSIVLPRHVRRAQDYLQAHAHECISAEQLAEVAGVSLRSLYAGFQHFLGMSPMQYLRDVRMERVRAELVNGGADNVAGVALRWGFAHMGRFSTEYRLRYGETPSQTLRKR